MLSNQIQIGFLWSQE